ncbi:hypothetical protein L7F22_012820 [Adiantum nelumboides]|nr:hypothetical protein [Adiantum nelumboides]
MPNDASSVIPEGNYQMDHNTLWFIANNMARQGGPPRPRHYKSGPLQGAPPCPCYNCGEPHWVRECPHPRKDKLAIPGLPPLTRYCTICGINHLVQDCPLNPHVKGKAPVVLNLIDMKPSTGMPSSSKSDVLIPLKVITRVQAKARDKHRIENKGEVTPSESSKKSKKKESWKARRERRAASRKHQKQNTQGEKNETKENTPNLGKELPGETNNENQKETERQPAGLVLAEKHFEPLDAVLQAYEARLKPLETLEERWKHYPDPAIETRQLEIFKQLVKATQALEEQLKTNNKQKDFETNQDKNDMGRGKIPLISKEEKRILWPIKTQQV